MPARPASLKERWFAAKKRILRLAPGPVRDAYFAFYPAVGHIVYGRPSRRLTLVGVTGTDGKSSTVLFLARILREAGHRTGFFCSIGYGDGAEVRANGFKMTMPGRFFLQRFLSKLVRNGCEFAVIEVTSEGVRQLRHLFLEFDVAAITNIQPEHIEAHGGFEQYKAAKAAIFKGLSRSYRKGTPKIIVANRDDAEAASFLSFAADRTVTFSVAGEAEVAARNVTSDFFTTSFAARAGDEETAFTLPMGGPFFAENALAAISIAHALGVPLAVSKKTFEQMDAIPGRFEIVSKDPLIIVDYAHTIAGVKKVLSFVRGNWHGRIVHVFGAAGGGRDKWKRPELAACSETYTDFSILTEENPFDEDPEAIVADIHRGFKNKDRVAIVPRREDAIREALKRASPDTLFIFTGKGSETVIAEPLGRRRPYNEKTAIVCELGRS